VNSDADGVVQLIQQPVEPSLCEVAHFQFGPGTLDKQLTHHTHTEYVHWVVVVVIVIIVAVIDLYSVSSRSASNALLVL